MLVRLDSIVEEEQPKQKGIRLSDIPEIPETPKPTLPTDRPLSRNELSAMGVTYKTNLQQRQVITDVLNRKINELQPTQFNVVDPTDVTVAPIPETGLSFDDVEKNKSFLSKKGILTDIGMAIKELPENLKIGTISIGANILFALKRRGMQLAGGGILPDEAVKHQFEPVKPQKPEDKRLDRKRIPGLIYPSEMPLPGSVLGEAAGIVSRLPSIGGTILKTKAMKLAQEQDKVTLQNAPVTRLMRSVTQSGVPSLGAAIGISVLTGNPLIGIALLGETSGGSEFQEQLETGASIMKANVIADFSEVAEISGEMLVFPKILKGVTKGFSLRSAFITILENANQEGVTGFNQEFVSIYGKETSKGTSVTDAIVKAFNAGIKVIPENAWVGGATAGGAAVISSGIDVILPEQKPAAAPAQEPSPPPSERAAAVTPEIILYHGTNAEFADVDIETGRKMYGIHLTTDESVAQEYGKVKKYFISPDTKVLDLSDGESTWDYLIKNNLLDEEQANNPDLENYTKQGQLFQYDITNGTNIADDIAKTAESQGYDLIKMADDLGGKGDNTAYVVVNKAIMKPVEAGMPLVAPTIEGKMEGIEPPIKTGTPTEAVQAQRIEGKPVKAEEKPKIGTIAAKEAETIEKNQKSNEPVDVELYIGNVTPGMKSRIASAMGVKPEDVAGFKKGAFPTKQTKFTLARSEAENYREWLEKDLMRRIDESKIKTDHDIAMAEADWGDIKRLRAALGMKADLRQPFKVIRAKKEGMVFREQGEIKKLTSELDALQKQLEKAKSETEKSPIMEQITEKEELLRQMLKSKGQAVKVLKDTKSSIWQAVRGEQESELSMMQALNIVMKRSEQFAGRAFTAGSKEVVEKHKELLNYAKQELPQEYNLLKRASTQIVKSRTPAQIKAVTDAVDRMVSQYEKSQSIKGVKEAIGRAKKVKLRPEFQKMLAGLEGISLKTSRQETIDRMKSLVEAAQQDEHQIGDIPQKLIDKANQVLADTKKPTLADFSKEELELLSDTISSVIHQNTTKNQLLAQRTSETRDEVIKSGNDFIKKVWGEKHDITPSESDKTWFDEKMGSTLHWVKKIALTGQLSYDRIVRMIVGRNSSVYKTLYQTLQEKRNLEQDIVDDFKNYILKSGVTKEEIKISSNIKKGVTVNLPDSRNEKGQRVEQVKLTRGEILDFAKLVLDPENRAALLDNKMEGLRLARQGKKGHSFSISVNDLKAMLDAVPSDMKKILADWHDYTNGTAKNVKHNIRQELSDEWLKEHGFPLKLKENYSTRERYSEALETKKHDPMMQFKESYLENMGMFKQRQGSTAPFVIRNGYARMASQVSRMAAYASKATALNDAYSILYDRSFRETVSKAFKDGEQLLTYMEKDLVKYNGRNFLDLSTVSEVLKKLTPKMHVGVLAAKPYIVAYQPVSILAGLSEIDGKYLLNPKHLMPSEIKRIRKQLNETSPTLRSREEASGAQIMNPVQADNALEGFFGFEKKRLKGLHKSDSWSISFIGLAAESEGKSKGLTGNALKEYTARRTEEIVDTTQSTWDPLTISQLASEGHDNPFEHQLVMFSSQRSKNTNILIGDFVEYYQNKKLGKPASKSKIVKDIVTTQIAQNLTMWGIRTAYFAALSAGVNAILKRPDDKEKKNWAYHVVNLTGQILGNWVIVGDVMDSLLRVVVGQKEPGQRERGTVLGETVYQTGEALAYLRKAAVELKKDAETGEMPKLQSGPNKDEYKAYIDFWRFIESGLNAAGPLTGLPTQSLVIHTRLFMPQHKTQEKKENEEPVL